MSLKWIVGGALVAASVGAASPAADQDPVSRIEAQFAQDARLDDVGFPLLKATVPFCGDAATRRPGFRYTSVAGFARELKEAGRLLGYVDTVSVVSVAKGGPADRAGLKAHDRILSVDGAAIPVGTRGMRALRSRLQKAGREARTEVQATVRRRGATQTLTIPLDSACAFSFVSWRETTADAWGDGEAIAVTVPMMQYAATDSVLAVVVAHEIAHNAIRRTTASSVSFQEAWRALGEVVGEAAIYAKGERWASMREARPSGPFPGEVENRADDLTAYLLARVGRKARTSRDVWWSLLVSKDSTLAWTKIHPTTADRLFRLDQIVSEVDAKKSAGI